MTTLPTLGAYTSRKIIEELDNALAAIEGRVKPIILGAPGDAYMPTIEAVAAIKVAKSLFLRAVIGDAAIEPQPAPVAPLAPLVEAA